MENKLVNFRNYFINESTKILNKEILYLFKKFRSEALIQYKEILQKILDDNQNIVEIEMGVHSFVDKDGEYAQESDNGDYFYFRKMDEEKDMHVKTKVKHSDELIEFLSNLEHETGLDISYHPCFTVNGKIVLDQFR